MLPTTTATPTPSPTSTPSPSITTGAIAGIVIGAVLGLAAIIAAIYYCGRNSVYRQWYKSEKRTQASTESWLSRQQYHDSPTMSPKPVPYTREQYLGMSGPHEAEGSPPPTPMWWTSPVREGEFVEMGVQETRGRAELGG